jgi:hypothetical protein
MRQTTMVVVCTLVLALCAGSAFAAGTNYPATLQVSYFINANTSGAPGAVVQVVNTGLSGGNLCADIFVYDPSEEIQECCSCLITPNDLRTLSVNVDLTSNTLTHNNITTGSIFIVSAKTSSSGTCPLPTNGVIPVPGATAWGTHIQAGNSITETAYQSETLGSAELGLLETDCLAVSLAGSGSGQCSCGSGD